MLELSRLPSDEAEAVIAALLPQRSAAEEAVMALIARLRRNRYPLLMLEAAASRRPLLAGSPAWQQALAADRASLEEQRREFLMAQDAWQNAGIPSVLFKSGGLTPSFPYTSDNVDVLVPRNRTLEARRILMSRGYVWLRNIDEEQKWLFRKFHAGRSVSAIHVHGWVGWDVEFHGRAVWDGVRQAPDDPRITVPSREDALLINAAHALYENKEIRLYDLEKIRAQWRHDLDWDYIESVARKRGWLDGLYTALLISRKLERALYGACSAPAEAVMRWKRGLRSYHLQWRYWKNLRKREFELPFRVSFVFSKVLYYKKIARDDSDGLRSKATNVVRTLAWGIKQKSGIRPQRGRLIALSGLDGSGKTAHAGALSQAMDTSEVINRVVWSRCGCSPLYRAARRLVGRAASSPPGSSSSGRRIPGGLIGAAWAWANALDLALLYQWKVRLPLATGKVVICDRYAADAAVEIGHRLGVSDPMSLAAVRALVRLSPRPHAAYLLGVPADVAAGRSLDAEEAADLESQRALYGRALLALRMRLLDVTRDFAEANDRLVREVLQEYEDSFPTLTNGLFLSNPDQLNPGEAAR
jgi:thymidylate kinase